MGDFSPNLPAQGPATLGGVRAFLRYRVEDTEDDTRLEAVVAAVNAKVRGWRCCADSVGESPEAATWTANVVEGATLLAGRLFHRRESPSGVAAMGEGFPVYVSRNDPDVAMLLGLGSWSSPQVG